MITGEETWSGEIFITGDVTVASTGKLTILPGTVIKFDSFIDDQISGANTSKCELIVKGNGILLAEGTQDNPILFTSIQGKVEEWQGIINDSNNTVLRYATIKYASNGLYFISPGKIIEYCTFEKCMTGVACSKGCYGEIINCVIKENEGSGIYLESNYQFSFATISAINCSINNNKGAGIVGSSGIFGNGSQIRFNNCKVTNNGAEAISIGWAGVSILENCVIDSNKLSAFYNHGGGINLTIKNSTISNNGGGVVVGELTIIDSSIFNNGSGVYGGILTALNNTIYNNRDYGICLDKMGENGLKGNEIYKNKYGIQINNPPVAKYELTGGNNIYDNTTYEIINNGSSAIISNGNYWGEPTTSELKVSKPNLTEVYDSRDDASKGAVTIKEWSEIPIVPAPTATATPTPVLPTPTPISQTPSIEGVITIYSEDFEIPSEFSLPSGWKEINYTTPLDGSYASGQANKLASSKELEGWTILEVSSLQQLGNNQVNTPSIVSGKSVFVESDGRSGLQIQYLYTPVYDLEKFKDIHLKFSSNYVQNQDNIAFCEYSLQGDLQNDDPNKKWLPIFYWVDKPELDNASGDINYLLANNYLDDNSYSYNNYIGASPSQIDILKNVEGRVNDDQLSYKKIESFSLSQASFQKNVQIRFFYGGGDIWYWGIDNFLITGIRNDEAIDTPTPTPIITNTPKVPSPTSTPTPTISSGVSPTPTIPPIIVEPTPVFTFEFDKNKLSDNGWSDAMLGGFSGNPAGVVKSGMPLGDLLFPASKDKRGLMISVAPSLSENKMDEVCFVNCNTLIETRGLPVLIVAYIQSDNADTNASIYVGALKGDFTKGGVDGSISYHAPANSVNFTAPRRVCCLYEPDGDVQIITPFIQIAAKKDGRNAIIYVDRVEIYLVPEEMKMFSSKY